MKRIAILLAVALAGAVAGGFVTWQYMAWRVVVADGKSDAYAMAAVQMVEACGPQRATSQWPKRQGP